MSTTMNESSCNEQLFHQEHASELLQQLQSLLSVGENGGLCDVVLIAGKNGQRVPAHRVILAASSPYFRSMFTGGMRESSASEVTLGDDVHGDYLLPLVNFCYTGKIEICTDTVDELVQTASRLQLDAVVSACSAFMKRRLEVSNCIGVAALAEILSLDDLKQVADKYAQRHFVQVSQEEEFLRLNIAELKILIASDCLNVPSEEFVFNSVISWLNYDTEKMGTRLKHTPALLALVRLSHLPVTLTEQMVCDLCQEHECLPLLREALKEANVLIGSRRIKPRKSVKSGFLAVWFDEQKALHIAEYSHKKDEWKLFDNTFFVRTYFGAAFFNNELVVVGGKEDNVSVNTVESINLDTMTSTQMPSMAQKRSNFGIAVLDGLLYVAGGSDDSRVNLNRVERYDPNDRKWSEVAPMSVARIGFGLTELDGRLFAVGGRNDFGSPECYDPQTNKWTMVANLNKPRSQLSVASGNGFLYAVGRLDDDYAYDFDDDDCIELVPLHSIECYDPQADKWTEICSSSNPGYIVGCIYLNDCVFVLKSYEEKTLLEEYNIVTDKWSERAKLANESYLISESVTFSDFVLFQLLLAVPAYFNNKL